MELGIFERPTKVEEPGIFERPVKSDSIDGRLSLTNVLEMIPPLHYNTRQPDKKRYTEWCWRILEFPDERTVEISYHTPGQSRKYMDNTGGWIECEIPKEFDEYVVKTYYAYTK